MIGLERVYGKVTSLLPPRLAAHVDRMRPSLRSSWGGPMNGQLRRQELVQNLASSINFELVIETGTYRGSTTEFLATISGVSVHTVENNPRYYEYSRQRFSDRSDITVHFGDSRAFLRSIPSIEPVPVGPVLFYLDAHWEQDLPLCEEVLTIAANFSEAVIMIDDFRVDHDPGYLFDSYGPDKELTAAYLPMVELPGWKLFYPSAPSTVETGNRRGCGVLVSPQLADHLASVDGLYLA